MERLKTSTTTTSVTPHFDLLTDSSASVCVSLMYYTSCSSKLPDLPFLSDCVALAIHITSDQSKKHRAYNKGIRVKIYIESQDFSKC